MGRLGWITVAAALLATLTTATQAAPQLNPTPSSPFRRVAIIGEGVIGLSTATAILELQQAHPEEVGPLSIDVFSDLDWDHTLSKGIAGLFRIDKGTRINRIYGNETFSRHARLFREIGGVSGVQLVSGHIISDKKDVLEEQRASYADIVYNFRFLEPREIRQQFQLDDYAVDAIHYTAYTSEGLKYCPFMKERLISQGVNFHRRHVDTVDQLGEEGFDVVINCAGLQGGNVANDGDHERVFPVRGVIIKVDAPWQKHFLYRDFSTFTIPVIDGVYVGTVKQDNVSDMETTNEEIEEVFGRYVRLQPAMRNVTILSHFVGLRPGRDQVRVASVKRSAANGRTFTVVHNYGHGGNGFTLGYGSSLHAARLALDLDTRLYDEAIGRDLLEKEEERRKGVKPYDPREDLHLL